MALKKKNYQTSSNIILGSIFTVLFFLFGSMHFLILNHFKTDPKYLYEIEKTIQVDFPSHFTIITEDNTKGKQATNDNFYYKYESVVRFVDEEEVLMFENNLNENYWVDSFSEKQKIYCLNFSYF